MAHENDWVINGDIPYRQSYPSMNESINLFDEWIGTNKNWAEKTWPGSYNTVYGRQVWTDGTNIYHSYGSSGQYVFNKSEKKWTRKSWSGSYYPTYGQYVWTDGDTMYYSDSRGSTYTHSVLNKSTGQWVKKSWNINLIHGPDVWTDGENVYCNCIQQSGSYSIARKYVLDKSTGNWVGKDWGDKYPTYGRNVWSDGENLYYSLNGINYVLDKTTGQWVDTTWSGLERFSGIYVWTDGKDIYYSNGADQYILNKSTKTWTVKNWTNPSQFSGMDVWTDGDNTYYSSGSTYYILSSGILPYRIQFPELKESFNADNEWVIDNDIPYRVQFPELNTSINFSDIWLIGNDIPYRYDYPALKESFDICGEWLTQDEPDTSSTKKYLKFTHTVTATFTAGNRVPVVTYDFPDSSYYTVPRYWDQGISSWSNIYGRIFVPSYAKVRKDEWDLSNTDIYNIMNPSMANYFKKLDGYNATIDPTSDKLHYDSGDYYWAYPSPDYGTNKYYIEFSLAMLRQLTPSESGSTTITFAHIFEFDSENDDYRAFLEAYPNNVEPWYPMVKAIPFRLDFPALNKSLPGGDIWLIDDEYPYRVDFPELKVSAGAFTGWLQNTGYSPYRPWPNHKTIFQSAEPIEIPEIDWTKGMQQTFEYFKVDPNTWNDYEQITTVISSNITKDTDSEMRGHASIETSEALDECYIRTYMVIRQNSIKQRVCLGTHLYMVQSDSFNGMRHQYNYTGYTPLVELREKLIPLGYSVVGVTGEVNGKVAPMLSDEIAQLISQNSRVKLENRVKVEEPLLNNFVAGTTDNILTVVNNLLNASSLQKYQVTVDEFGTVCIKEAISVYNERHVFEYTDDNSSILMADINLASDLSSIPNVLEVIYAGDANKDIGAVRVVVRNEDPNSVVSTVSRGREVWSRVVISNIGSPYDKSEITRQAVVDQVTNQAYRLLEDASTIRKTIQYEHGYCDVEIGDTVLFNYKRAGLIGIKAKVVSQTITCKPGCKVSEMAVYTKKLWNRGV